ncbi:putative acyltransferase family protein [Golovinomyces cichoracearum]|uniref:Putative acyltransferase family protein n=1 Tax=Golovinomyces cichoracearum TaxID=62708 RepID=A0A420IA16_9PEZI|nr:putative acyltransferase family protein [Golovinomyces cichoracearum]
MSTKSENVKWVDGLRGCASLLVVFTHIARAFDVDLFKPTSAEGIPPRILQYPFIRVLIQGRIGVSIFSLVTGYVCALKPLRQIRSGNVNAAFNSIARSAFRRIPRLILPTTIATVIIWILCQFGLFEVANRVESQWLNHSSPDITPFIGPAIRDLLYNLVSTWTKEFNKYDINQWTLFPLLKGSMMVYITLVATAYCNARYRMLIELCLFMFEYVSKDATFGMLFFFGVFLSDLSQHPSHINWLANQKWFSRVLSPLLILFGLFLASYPEDQVQWVHWSRLMGQYSVYIFPKDNETPRFYTGVGLIFICLGIHISNSVKEILSHKYLLWFGKNSFAVYLLHGTLLRTILVWMYFGIFVPPDITHEDGTVERGHLNYPGRLRWYFWMPIWFCILYWTASIWTKYVDPWCARVTEVLVKFVFDEPSSDTAEKLTLPV